MTCTTRYYPLPLIPSAHHNIPGHLQLAVLCTPLRAAAGAPPLLAEYIAAELDGGASFHSRWHGLRHVTHMTVILVRVIWSGRTNLAAVKMVRPDRNYPVIVVRAR